MPRKFNLSIIGTLAGMLAISPVAFAQGNFLPPGGEGGSGGVDQSSGAYNYTYPITVPVGPRDIKPTIALSYSSQAHHLSWLGTGWSLQLGSIVRIGSAGGSPTLAGQCAWSANNGALCTTAYACIPSCAECAPPECRHVDNYVLSLPGVGGGRLVLDPSSAGEFDVYPTIPYRTEHDSFVSIRPMPSVPGAGEYPQIPCTASQTTDCDARGWWEVKDTDGTTYRFGTGAAESDRLTTKDHNPPLSNNLLDYTVQEFTVVWALSEVEDTFGNKLLYTYSKGNWGFDGNYVIGHNNLHPSNITYVDANGVELYRITFEKEEMLPNHYYSFHGVMVRDSQQLHKIKIGAVGATGNTIPMWGYEFYYSANPGGWDLINGRPPIASKHLLTKIARLDYNDSPFESPLLDCFYCNPATPNIEWHGTDFNYYGQGDTFSLNTTTSVINSPFYTWDTVKTYKHGCIIHDGVEELSPGSYDENSTMRTLQDMNGDGFPDLVVVVAPGTGVDWDIYYGTGAGLGPVAKWPGSSSFSEISLTTMFDTINHDLATTTKLMDYNGDGLPDYITVTPQRFGLDALWDVYYNTGTGFDSGRGLYFRKIGGAVPEEISHTNGAGWKNSDLVDMNGDGWLDYVWSGRIGDTFGWWVNISDSGYLGAPVRWRQPGMLVGGRTDLGYGRYGRTQLLVDMNGDGLVDHVRVDSCDPGVACDRLLVSLNNGHADVEGGGGFEYPIAWKGTTREALALTVEGWRFLSENSGDVMAFRDITGDGLPDIIARAGSNVAADLDGDGIIEWNFFENTGVGFAPPKELNGMTGLIGSYLIDINGDRSPDYVVPSYVSPTSGKWTIRYGENIFPRLLRRVVSPLGGVTEISYSSSATTVDSRVPSVFPVVSGVLLDSRSRSGWAVTAQENIDARHEKSYTYYYGDTFRAPEAVIFEGFAKAKEEDLTTSNYIESHFTTSAPSNYGQPVQKVWFDASGVMLRKERSVFKSDSTEPYFTPVVNQYTSLYSVDGRQSTRTRVEFVYSADYGTVIEKRFHGQDVPPLSGDEKTMARQFYYPNTTGSYMVLPRSEEVRAGIGLSGALLAKTEFRYDGLPGEWDEPTEGFLYKVTKGIGKDVAISYINWDGLTETYQRDPYGRKTSLTDPNGNVGTIEYFAAYPNYIKSETNAKGHTVSYEYKHIENGGTDGFFGQLSAVLPVNARTADGTERVDKLDYLTSYAYDTFGRLTKVTKPGDHNVTAGSPGSIFYEYSQRVFSEDKNAAEILVKVRDDTSHVPQPYALKSYFDGFGREYRTSRPGEGGDVINTKVQYNSLGKVAFESAPSYGFAAADTRLTQFEYDVLGRVTKIDKPDGPNGPRVVTKVYDQFTTTVTNESMHTTTITVDAYGNVVSFLDPLNVNPTTYEYDLFGNLTRMVDVAGNISEWTYDSLSRRATMYDPDMGPWTYFYDAAGNLRRTVSRGGTKNYTYDALNRVLTSDANNDGVSEVIQTYDDDTVNGLGRLTRTTNCNAPCLNAEVREEFVYDERGRMLSELRVIPDANNIPKNFTTTWVYNSKDRITDKQTPNLWWISYDYNTMGKVDSIRGIAAGSGWRTYVTDVEYGAQGNMIFIAYGNGTSTRMGYHPTSDMLESIYTVNGQTPPLVLQDLKYTFDNRGNLSSLANFAHPTDPVKRWYRYDVLDRLTGVFESGDPLNKPADPINRYEYDAIGNMTFKDEDGLALVAVAGAAPVGWNQFYESDTLAKGGPHAISYRRYRDTAQAYSYQYDGVGNLLDGGGKTMTWTSEGRLWTIAGTELESSYLYDAANRRVRKRWNQGIDTNFTYNFAYYGGNDYILQTWENGDTRGHRVSVGLNGVKVLDLNDPSLVVTLRLFDHLGSTNVVTYLDGPIAPIERIQYQPYGVIPSASVPSIPTSSYLPLFKYMGREWEQRAGPHAGLYDFGDKIYDADIGRYLSSSYVFSGNNPMSPEQAHITEAQVKVGSATDLATWGYKSAPSRQSIEISRLRVAERKDPYDHRQIKFGQWVHKYSKGRVSVVEAIEGNPGGGWVGPDRDLESTLGEGWYFVAEQFPGVQAHSFEHDAAGYLKTEYGIGPGYDYAPLAFSLSDPISFPMKLFGMNDYFYQGQFGGLLYQTKGDILQSGMPWLLSLMVSAFERVSGSTLQGQPDSFYGPSNWRNPEGWASWGEELGRDLGCLASMGVSCLVEGGHGNKTELERAIRVFTGFDAHFHRYESCNP